MGKMYNPPDRKEVSCEYSRFLPLTYSFLLNILTTDEVS
jgi:hypothetical protein